MDRDRARTSEQGQDRGPLSGRPWLVSYAPGVEPDVEVPADSLPEMLEASAARFGDRVALDFFGAETTYVELADQVSRAAQALGVAGVRAGDRVALVLPNCPQHVVAFYAVLRLGAVVVEHNPLYTSRELRHQFEDHQARIVIAWDKAVSAVQSFPADVEIDHVVSVNLLKAFPAVKRLALHLPVRSLRDSREALTGPAPGTIPWEKLLTHGRIAPDHPRPAVDDVAAIQYTSGTTGHPKGAMLTHFNLYSNALQGEAWMLGAEYRKEIFYAILPMFHAFGMTLYLTS